VNPSVLFCLQRHAGRELRLTDWSIQAGKEGREGGKKEKKKEELYSSVFFGWGGKKEKKGKQARCVSLSFNLSALKRMVAGRARGRNAPRGKERRKEKKKNLPAQGIWGGTRRERVLFSGQRAGAEKGRKKKERGWASFFYSISLRLLHQKKKVSPIRSLLLPN